MDINNAAGYLGGESFQERIAFQVETPQFSATAKAVHRFDRRRQLLVRERTWYIAGQPPIEDFCRYRLFFPAELEHLLAEKGFQVGGDFARGVLLYCSGTQIEYFPIDRVASSEYPQEYGIGRRPTAGAVDLLPSQPAHHWGFL